MTVATRIPKRMLQAVTGTPEPVQPTRLPNRPSPARVFHAPARPLPKKPCGKKAARLPLDQRLVSVPLWWLRWGLLKLSKGLTVLNYPAYGVYKLALGVNWIGANYGKVRSFAVAHAAGPVRRRTWTARARQCKGCEYHYKAADKKRYCRGENGGRGCGCGHWRLARLTNKLGLSGWRCPVGRFDYGLLGRLIRGQNNGSDYMARGNERRFQRGG